MSKYSPEKIEEAKNLVRTLQEFSNKQIGLVSETRVTDSNRHMTIIGILCNEYGQEILSCGIIKVFGEDTVTKKYAKRNRHAQDQTV